MITFSKDCTQFMWLIAETVLKDGAESGPALWQQRMKSTRGCTQDCLFGKTKDDMACAHCLEGRFRTLNLYRQTPLSVDCVFMQAAQVLMNQASTPDKASPVAA